MVQRECHVVVKMGLLGSDHAGDDGDEEKADKGDVAEVGGDDCATDNAQNSCFVDCTNRHHETSSYHCRRRHGFVAERQEVPSWSCDVAGREKRVVDHLHIDRRSVEETCWWAAAHAMRMTEHMFAAAVAGRKVAPIVVVVAAVSHSKIRMFPKNYRTTLRCCYSLPIWERASLHLFRDSIDFPKRWWTRPKIAALVEVTGARVEAVVGTD